MPCLEQLLLDTGLVAGGQATKWHQGCNSLAQLVGLAETAVWRGIALGHNHYVYYPLTIHRC